MSLNHWKKFFKRILLLCFIYSISRIAFYLYNIKINEFDRLILALIEGIRFDLSALLYINLPLLFLLLIHYFSPKSKLLNRLINLLFYLINIPFIILNNIDIIFYSFNLKRSTIDFFNFITYTDLKNVYFNYLFEYWPITLLSFLQIWILIKIKQLPNLFKRKINHILLIIVGLFILIIGLRGGTQLKPIKPIHAGVLLKSGHPEVVLNTPFTILHSYNQENLKNIKYYDTINKLDFNPVHNYKNGNFNKSNVVIIILESFSKEFIGYYNSGDGYTPFLDSLMNTGLVLENAFANGVRSIEALPAITASIPSLMTESFITTPYANNHIVSIAEILKKEGYSTSFFHGGEKGTMGFYEYCQKVGFENYYGKDQHTNKEDYDGNWGIYDQPFFQFFANKLNQTKEPFFSTFFSLTSHPPYQLPQELSEKFPKGELAIHQSIGYSDYALKKFFEEAQSMKWFDNTLFVITADRS